MAGNFTHPQRKNLRLPGYDYSLPGAYFVTIVTQDRLNLFGKIIEGENHLNDAGVMIEKWWFELGYKFPLIQAGEHIVMPNHFHGILWITEPDTVTRINPDLQTSMNLSAVLQWFKTMTTNEYIRNVKQNHWPAFPGKLWQRNFYEHIGRDEADVERIRAYIAENPIHWDLDQENMHRP